MQNAQPRLTVLTYNVWFDNFEFDRRVAEILRLVEASRPDVVLLQEVLPEFVDAVFAQPWAVEEYAISCDAEAARRGTFDGGVQPYGVLTLVKKALRPRFSVVGLPGRMARTLLCAAVEAHGAALAVGNVHLESLGNQRTREAQLRVVAGALAGGGDALLGGDFNFGADPNWSARYRGPADGTDVPPETLDNACLAACLPGFVDVWPALRPAEPRYTFDSAANKGCRGTSRCATTG